MVSAFDHWPSSERKIAIHFYGTPAWQDCHHQEKPRGRERPMNGGRFAPLLFLHALLHYRLHWLLPPGAPFAGALSFRFRPLIMTPSTPNRKPQVLTGGGGAGPMALMIRMARRAGKFVIGTGRLKSYGNPP